MPKRTKSEGTSPNPLFVYHPPTEEQVPKYQKLNLAFGAVMSSGREIIRNRPKERAEQERFDGFSKTCEAYHDLIVELCPESADRTAAIRCLRLARNAINDILCGTERDFPHGLSQHPFSLVFETELVKCRYQANASIALEGK